MSRIVTFFAPFPSDMCITAEVRQLSLPELTVGKLGMRDYEPVLQKLFPLDEYNVEIEGSRAPSHSAHPARSALDAMQCSEQRSWRECCRHCDHLIQVLPLRNGSNRVGLLDFRRSNESCIADCGNGGT